MQTFPLRAALLAAAVLLAGCHDETPPPPTVVTAPGPSTTTVVPSGTAPAVSPVPVPPGPDTKINTNAGPGGSTGTDAALADKINTAIVHNKQMTGSRVEVVATGGVVTLNGTVQNGQQKALAQAAAQNVPGVGSIKNKLMIVTTGGPKPKPTVVTKTKTVVIQAPARPASGTETEPAGRASGAEPVPDTSSPSAPPADSPSAPASDSTGGGATGQ